MGIKEMFGKNKNRDVGLWNRISNLAAQMADLGKYDYEVISDAARTNVTREIKMILKQLEL